jgi:hypothetical protein
MADVTIPGLSTQLTSVDRAADLLEVSDTSDSGNSKKASVNNLLDLTTHPVGVDDVQTLTNKTISTTNTITQLDSNFTLQDNGDPTKQAQFNLTDITAGQTRVFRLPNLSDILVTESATQGLANKTLQSPTINAPIITNPTITVDTISEFTSANGVTVDGLNIKDSRLNTNNSVPNNALINTGTFGSSWAWADWSPTLTNLSGGTLTFAKFTQQGKTVRFRLKYVLAGAGVAGAVTFTLPVTAATQYGTSNHQIGEGILDDGGATFYQGVCFLAASTTIATIRVLNASATYATYTALSSTVPFTWASTDVIQIQGEYEAA